MLHEDLQGVCDTKELVFCRVGEYLDHVAELGVQLVHDAEFVLDAGNGEFDRSRLSDFLSAAWILIRFDVLLNGEKWFWLALLSCPAIDNTLKFDFERLYRLLASAIVMVDIHADFLARCENKLFKRDHGSCLRCTQAADATYLAFEGSLEFWVDRGRANAHLSQF